MTEKYNHMQSESILNDKFNNEVEQTIKEVRRGKCDSFTSTDKLILNAQKTVLETMVIDLYTKNLNTEYNNSEIDFNEYNRIKASLIEELSLNEEKIQEI